MKSIKAGVLSILIFCALLAGCGKPSALPGPAATGSEETDALPKYERTERDLSFLAEYQPAFYSFLLKDSQCYFFSSHSREEEQGTVFSAELYAAPLKGETAQKLLALEGERLLSYDVRSGADGETQISTLSLSQDACVFRDYAADGTMQRETVTAKEDFPAEKMLWHRRLSDGGFLAAGHYELYLVTPLGEVQTCLPCPGENFQGGVVTDNAVYLTYQEKTSGDCVLAELNRKEGALKPVCVIPGDGSLLACDAQGGLYTIDSEAVYLLDTEKGKHQKVMALSDFRGVSIDHIQALSVSEGKIELLSRDKKRLLFMAFQETEEGGEQQAATGRTDQFGRRIITLYDPMNLAELLVGKQLIEDFNFYSETYVLEVEAAKGDVSARLADPDSPDLMLFLEDTQVRELYEQGYLENLLPYFERSELVKSSDLSDALFACFGFDEGLYGIPRRCSVETILGRGSQVGGKPGWTAEEFLSFLEEHRDLGNEQGLSREVLLDHCLKGSLEQFADIENKKAHFRQEDFMRMLERIKNLTFTELPMQEERSEKWNPQRAYLYDAWISGVGTGISMPQALCGEELVWKGFPNAAGEPVAILKPIGTLCVLKKSECREGAFAFLEYALTYPAESLQDWVLPTGEVVPAQSNGELWPLKSLYEAAKECSFGERSAKVWMGEDAEKNPLYMEIDYEITPEDYLKMEEILRRAKPDSGESRAIRAIVKEEAERYFRGEKSLSSVCDVIQNRVQLYLNE